MSPRPKNIRKVNNMPSVAGFRPVISNNSCEETIFLHFEEYETIRLCDYEMKTQQEASISMGVSRPTLSRIYTSARQKIAKAFVCGAAIMIEGGVSYTNSEWFRCGSCGFLFNNINPALKIRKTVCPVCLSEDIHTSNININKNKIMMKIAIPTRDNVIDNHFGHCEYYTILTVGQDNQILSSETIPSPQGCGCKSNIAGELEGMGVSVMLAENIALGRKKIDYDRVKEILEQVSLSRWAEALPDGIHTLLGEAGGRLSGGQRQRIGIARALYKRVEVLLLDEATSALDNVTEKEINETLCQLKEKYKGLTILSIAHRESSLTYCERIITIKNEHE